MLHTVCSLFLQAAGCSLALYQTLQIIAALHDIVSYILSFAQLGNSCSGFRSLIDRELTADWGGTEGIGKTTINLKLSLLLKQVCAIDSVHICIGAIISDSIIFAQKDSMAYNGKMLDTTIEIDRQHYFVQYADRHHDTNISQWGLLGAIGIHRMINLAFCQFYCSVAMTALTNVDLSRALINCFDKTPCCYLKRNSTQK